MHWQKKTLRFAAISKLTGEQVRVLAFLISFADDTGEVQITITEAANELSIKPNNFSRAVRTLVSQRIILNRVSSKEDGKSVYYFNTKIVLETKPIVIVDAQGNKWRQQSIFD